MAPSWRNRNSLMIRTPRTLLCLDRYETFELHDMSDAQFDVLRGQPTYDGQIVVMQGWLRTDLIFGNNIPHSRSPDNLCTFYKWECAQQALDMIMEKTSGVLDIRELQEEGKPERDETMNKEHRPIDLTSQPGRPAEPVLTNRHDVQSPLAAHENQRIYQDIVDYLETGRHMHEMDPNQIAAARIMLDAAANSNRIPDMAEFPSLISFWGMLHGAGALGDPPMRHTMLPERDDRLYAAPGNPEPWEDRPPRIGTSHPVVAAQSRPRTAGSRLQAAIDQMSRVETGEGRDES